MAKYKIHKVIVSKCCKSAIHEYGPKDSGNKLCWIMFMCRKCKELSLVEKVYHTG